MTGCMCRISCLTSSAWYCFHGDSAPPPAQAHKRRKLPNFQAEEFSPTIQETFQEEEEA